MTEKKHKYFYKIDFNTKKGKHDFPHDKLTVEFPVSAVPDESSGSEVDELEIQSLEIDQKILVLSYGGQFQT